VLPVEELEHLVEATGYVGVRAIIQFFELLFKSLRDINSLDFVLMTSLAGEQQSIVTSFSKPDADNHENTSLSVMVLEVPKVRF